MKNKKVAPILANTFLLILAAGLAAQDASADTNTVTLTGIDQAGAECASTEVGFKLVNSGGSVTADPFVVPLGTNFFMTDVSFSGLPGTSVIDPTQNTVLQIVQGQTPQIPAMDRVDIYPTRVTQNFINGNYAFSMPVTYTAGSHLCASLFNVGHVQHLTIKIQGYLAPSTVVSPK
jgi:hypothetical protein